VAVRGERFRVRFWGVRGSYPTSNDKTLKFGGHTSCVEVEIGGHRLVFDAGTGIIALGKELLKGRGGSFRLNIFLSHTHHDHIMGFPFFEPLLKASTRLFLFGPDSKQVPLKAALRTCMSRPFFPIGMNELKARTRIYGLQGGETVRLRAGNNSPKVETNGSLAARGDSEVFISTYKSPAHPKNGVLLYRVSYQSRSLVYATDIEEKRGGYPEVIEFARESDLLIHDAQYLTSEYFSRRDPRKGWGHSTLERAVEVARKAHVKRLILFHHEPTRDDGALEEIERKAQRLFPETVAAYEGMKVDLLGDL